jgi:tetratricopeptide (TPR) repeat protein
MTSMWIIPSAAISDTPASAAHCWAERRFQLRILLSLGLVACFASAPSAKAQSGACRVQDEFARVDTLLKAHEYSRATAVLQSVRKCPNLSPSTEFALGWLYGRSHDFAVALSIFRSLPANVPDATTHQYAIALSEFELGHFTRSAEAINALATYQADSRCANLLGVTYSRMGRYDDAYRVFRENITEHPSDLSSYLNLITLLADTGHFDDAVTVASQSIAVFPQVPEAWVVRGAAYTLQGKLDSARADFAEAARLSPRDPSTRFFLSLSEYRSGAFSEAVAEIRSAIASGVEDSDLHYLLAECLLKTDPNGPQSALAELNRAIELNPNAAAAHTLRGKLLLEDGKVRAAYADLRLGHRLDPGSRSAAYNLARAERELGMTAQANILLQQLNSQDTDTLQELGDQKLHQALRADEPR